MIHKPRPWLSLLLGGLFLGNLTGCMGPRVHELPPANYSLDGVWELNPALSSDAEKVLASLQPKPPRGAPAPGRDQPAPEVINDPTTDLPPVDTSFGGRYSGQYGAGGANERNIYRPPLDFQTNALMGGKWLKIRQSDTELSIVNEVRSRTYTSGTHSVVSVPSGVADQDSGWSGRKYVVYLAPQIGPTIKEIYSLSADGQHLVAKIEVGSEGRNRAVTVIRTYDRSTKDPASFRQTLQETLPPTY